MNDENADSVDDEKQLVVNEGLAIPSSEFTFTFMRSSGPGGQNVNKVNTKVRLRWPVHSTQSLAADLKQRFVQKFRQRITIEGDFILTSQRYRDQSRNVADCLDKLRKMLLEVAVPPTRRKQIKPSRAAIRRRLDQKRRRSRQKQQRQPPREDD